MEFTGAGRLDFALEGSEIVERGPIIYHLSHGVYHLIFLFIILTEGTSSKAWSYSSKPWCKTFKPWSYSAKPWNL